MTRKRVESPLTFVERGFSVPQLREEFEKFLEQDDRIDEVRMRALFGPPPYYFLRNDELGESGGYTARRTRTMPYILDSNPRVFLALENEENENEGENNENERRAKITIKRHYPGREDDAHYYYDDVWQLLEPGGDQQLRATHRDKSHSIQFTVLALSRVGRRRATASATIRVAGAPLTPPTR